MYDVAAIMTVMVNALLYRHTLDQHKSGYQRKLILLPPNPPSGIPIAKQPMAASRVC